jgi:hypothetical protein
LLIVIIFILWVILACYSLVCIFIPEVRVFTWFGSGSKLGTLSYVGFAWFFGSPLFVATGVLAERYATLVYVTMIFAMIVMFIGMKVDRLNDDDR